MILGIGIPIVGDVPTEAYGTHLKAAAEARVHVDEIKIITCQNISPHDVARTVLIKKAFQEKCDLLFFIDADMILPTQTFKKLYDVLSDKKCVAVSGHYYRRGYPYTCVWTNVIEGVTILGSSALNGVHKIDSSGLGCCLIDLKWVAANLKEPYFKYEVLPNGDIKWEDAWFFARVRDAKGIVYGHGGVRCGHLSARNIVNDATCNELRKINTEKLMKEMSHGSNL